MEIYETLFIRNGFEKSLEIFKVLPVDRQEIMGVSVYRYEVNSSLVFLIYDLNLENPFSPQLFEHIQPHLNGLVLVAPEEVDEVEFSGKSWLTGLLEARTAIPTVLALQMADTAFASLDESIRQRGLYLGPAARLVYWSPSYPASVQNIWETLWMRIEPVRREESSRDEGKG